MRLRSLPRGLMVVGVVVATAAAVAAFDDVKSSTGSCNVCSTQMECPVMTGGTRVELLDIRSGVAMLMTVSEAEKVADFHQSWDRCKVEMDKAMKLTSAEAKAHLCGMCQSYSSLCRQGARFESVKTETGVLGLLTATKPRLVRAIHEQAARQREMMAKKAPCCSTP